MRNNNLIWVDDLQLFADNYNNRKHTTTKFKPNDIWTNDKKKVVTVAATDDLKQTKEQKISALSIKPNARVKKQIDKLRGQTFNVGDKVRVSRANLNGEVRKNR